MATPVRHGLRQYEKADHPDNAKKDDPSPSATRQPAHAISLPRAASDGIGALADHPRGFYRQATPVLVFIAAIFGRTRFDLG
jgi:hypothetical protein